MKVKQISCMLLALVLICMFALVGCKTKPVKGESGSSDGESTNSSSIDSEGSQPEDSIPSGESGASGVTGTTASNAGQGDSTAKPSGKLNNNSGDASVFNSMTKPVTLKVVVKTNPDNGDLAKMWFWQEIERLSHIHFDVQVVEAAVFHDQKALMILSNNLPDMFLGYAQFDSREVVKYGSEGVFIDIKDKVKNMKNLQKVIKTGEPNTLKGSTAPNGSIYSLPCFNTRGLPDGLRVFINQEWLDNLNLKMPKTIADFRKVLEAFRDRDPDGNGVKDTIPISGVGYQIFNYFRSAYGFVDDYDVIGGKLKYFPMEADYKNYMDTLNRFYTDNLIDHEMMFQTDEQFKAKASAGKVGVFAYTGVETAVGSEKSKWSQYDAMTPIIARSGIEPKYMLDLSVFQNCAMLTKANKHVDESLLFLDFLYTDTGTTMLRLGPEKGKWSGEGGWYKNSKGEVEMDVPKKYANDWLFINSMSPCINILPCYMPTPTMNGGKKDDKALHFEKMMKVFAANGRYRLPEFMYSVKEAEKLSELEPYIANFVQNKIPDYVIGVRPVSEIANDQTELRKQGVETIIKIKQDAYNRYIK